MNKYSTTQILEAKSNAVLHGFEQPTEEECIQFLDWYFSAKTEINSVSEAKRLGLSGLATNGVRQQVSAWEDILGEKRNHG